MSRCVSGHEPLKVQNSDGKSARVFQRNTDQAMAYTRCYPQLFINSDIVIKTPPTANPPIKM